MKIQFAEKCAWRAIYISAFNRQIFRLGVDPNDGVKPVLFIASGLFGWRGYRGLRIPLPSIAWGSTYRRPRWLWLRLYKLVKRFWHNVDGRYGWGARK